MDSTIPAKEQEPTLQDYLEIFLKRWKLIAATTASGLAAALAFSMLVSPVFQGGATLTVDRTAASLGLISDITGLSQETFVNTLAEIVKSRAIAGGALARLGVPERDREHALKRLQGGLRIERVSDTDVIRIQAKGPTPEAAAATTNAVAESFVAWEMEGRRAQAAASSKFIGEELSKVGQDLRVAENALAAYRARGGQVDLSEQTRLAVTRLADFEAQRRGVATELRGVEASLRQTQAALAQQAPTVPSAFTMGEDPVVSKLRQDLASREVDLAGLREKFTDDYPEVTAVKSQIEEIKTRLRQLETQRLASQTVTLNPLQQSLAAQVVRLEVERRALQAREAALAGVVERYNRDAQGLPTREVELAGLTRDVQVAEKTYLLLSGKLEDARIAEASTLGALRIVDRAVPPGGPVFPRKGLNTLFGALLGLTVGIGGVLTLEALQTTFKTPTQAAESLGLPLLATIPLWREPAKATSNGAIHLVTAEQRRTPFAESFRHLRTSLLYLSPDRPLRTILITSPGPDEGKTTIAANLALSVSQLDRKVWLVECDLRRPSLAAVFQSRGEDGLVNLLMGRLPLEQAAQKTEVENLWLIPSGLKPPNPAELLGSQKMRLFLSSNHSSSEFIVLDSPPVLPVTDATVLASAVDGVVLVVDLRKTHREAARRTKQQLEAMGARILGVVVNGTPVSRRGGYYGYYSYYDSESE